VAQRLPQLPLHLPSSTNLWIPSAADARCSYSPHVVDRRRIARLARRLYLRHRRAAAALLAGVAAFIMVRAASPPAAETVPVVVATADLAGGAGLQAGDVRVVRMPPPLAPAGSFASLAAVVGRTLAGPVRTGEPLTDRRLLGRPLLAAYGSGVVAAPVPLQDADVAALLHAGDVIDVYAATSTDEPARLLASAVPILALPQPTVDTEGGPLVVLAVTPSQAASMAAASAVAPLSITLRR
jgi:pilus assembly protein CpaB